MRTTRCPSILLAEDHDSIREMVRQWLANLGYLALTAANGEEALRLSSVERPPLAILDVVMPKMGGSPRQQNGIGGLRICL
jgi:CheY-like chemotaxis protein